MLSLGHLQREVGNKSDDNNWIGKLFVFLQWLMQAIVAVCLIGFLLNKAIIFYEKHNMKPLGDVVGLSQKHKVNLWCNGPTHG